MFGVLLADQDAHRAERLGPFEIAGALHTQELGLVRHDKRVPPRNLSSGENRLAGNGPDRFPRHTASCSPKLINKPNMSITVERRTRSTVRAEYSVSLWAKSEKRPRLIIGATKASAVLVRIERR